MTTNSMMILEFLKRNYGREVTKQEIVDALGVSMAAVNGSMTSLVKKGYATKRVEEVEVAPATDTKKAQVKNIMWHSLTEAGLTYDPVAEEEARAAEKAAEKERKAAERVAKKAAEE